MRAGRTAFDTTSLVLLSIVCLTSARGEGGIEIWQSWDSQDYTGGVRVSIMVSVRVRIRNFTNF